MASSIWFRFAALLFFISALEAKRNQDLCDIERTNYGLIPPTLPRNFEMKGESMDLNSKILSWHELYFDSDSLLGKYVILYKGVETHYIVNYEVGQAVEYYKLHPGIPVGRDPLSELCTAKDIEQSDVKNVFGYRKSNRDINRSRMFDSNEALRFGGPHPYSHQGFEILDDRGLNASAFKGCVYDQDDDETDLIYYYFSGPDTVPAGGTPESVVDGITENAGPLSVPLSRFGIVSIPVRNGSETKNHISNFTDNFSWFKGEPNFRMDTFKIPDWMYCKEYRGGYAVPQLPPGFSVRYELTTFTQDVEGEIQTATILLNYQVFYHYDKRLARLDFKPLKGKDTEITSLFQSDEPVRAIFDYNVGIKYIVHQTTGRCFAKPIDLGDMFDASKQTMVLKMGTPEEVLGIDAEEVEFKGKSIVRDITTDAWMGKKFVEDLNLTVFKEFYFATDGWHEESEETLEFDVPVRVATFSNRMEGGVLQQTVTEKNFFKFKPKTPDLIMFDITGCIEHIEHKFLAIVLSVPNENIEKLLRFRWNFQQAAQYYLAEASQIGTPLRIQRVVLHKSGTSLVITFAMLGKIELKTQVPYGQRGLSIDDAVDTLRKHVNNGKFSFEFTIPPADDFQDAEILEIFALPNSLHRFDPTQKTLFAFPVLDSRQLDLQDRKTVQNDEGKKHDGKEKPEPKKGMSAGGLAGLSITMLILGVAIGIAIMYMYIKKFSNASDRPDQYAMQNK